MKKEIIGNATLYLGDCVEIMKDMPDKSVDAVVTDPPYGVGMKYESFIDSKENVEDLSKKWLPHAKRIAERVCFTCGVERQWLYPPPTWVLGWFQGAGGASGYWGFNMWQPILCYGKDPFLQNGKGRRPDTIYTALPNTGVDKTSHPCPKPELVMTIIINRVSIGGDILDPFMGSGTTGAACMELGRKFIGIEIEEKYFDIACKRIDAAERQGRLFDAE
ncbi:MAG: hypothetical protein GWM98_11655 [Nitrospinaceae bacterium]|nr:hypothetical protein [Nitrospinaceae bacterium]NIR55039.1 hypothetical protein [Nitrospinaceae bacterium]NIS85438.1 hypothetical protein [Nitrospinaceae bacterium]NIT82277.1 hypothetical protein [Nitrospinaceae bacterium]NIU44508.1 hypothetical protein [Nitrospinaceae bacterium]